MIHRSDDEIREILRPPPEYQPSVPAERIRAIGAKQRRSNRITLIAAATVLVVGATALGSVVVSRFGDDSPPPASSVNTPVLTHLEAQPAPAALITTRAVLDRRGDCLYVDNHPVIWPPDASWREKKQAVALSRPEGELVFRVGQAFPADVAGGVLPLRLLDDRLTPAMLERAQDCMPPQAHGQVIYIS